MNAVLIIVMRAGISLAVLNIKVQLYIINE